ncbi:AhpC/TSA family protein [Ancylomarina salipaludis]|uniref:AhpC/TSA family protein n=1 Tax=Ancylomarina salipaludis TaxID=2501299 RepID=A0A4Q1JJI4_9BACT|nr:TlpA disulfide reductase family protein [Ancylomarina salipaludis]RXQ91490.1 AhpC/TSA family protein [Ancylomarina salipaludis]
MKKLKNYVLIVLCSLFLLSCGDTDNFFRLEGNIEGYSKGMAYLKQFNGKEFVCIDSTEINQGTFSFSGKRNQPQLSQIVVEGYKYPIRYFFLEAGQIDYKSKVNGRNLTVPVVRGTPTQNALNRYTSEREVLYRKVLALRRIKGKDEDEKKECQLQINRLELHMMELVKSFTQEDQFPVLSLYLIKENYTSDNDALKLENRLKPYAKDYAQHPLYKAIQTRVEELNRIAPGQQAPGFEMESLEGALISLSDFKGKITLIDFWASWCGPCRKENPNMVKLYQTYHEKGLEILGVSLDTSKERWAKAVEKDNLTWNHVCDFQKWQSPLVSQYAVRGVPFTVLIDKQGRIIASGLHGEALKSKVEEALGI